MDRHDRADPDKTVIKPRAVDPAKTVIAPRQKAASRKAQTPAAGKSPAAQPPKPPPAGPQPAAAKRPSAFPMVALGLAAFLLLSVTAGLVTVYVMTGGKTQVSDESLNADLVPVEPSEETQPGQPQIPEILPPKIIGLSGDPITIHRGSSVSRRLVKLGGQAVAAAAPIGVHGDIFRLSALLTSADDTLGAGLPGSPQSFAFFASAGGEAGTGGNQSHA